MAQVAPGRFPSELRGVVSGIVSRPAAQGFVLPHDEYERTLATSILAASRDDFESALEEVALSHELSASRGWVFGELGSARVDPLPDAPRLDFQAAAPVLGRWVGEYAKARDSWDAVVSMLTEERSAASSPPPKSIDGDAARFLTLLARTHGVTIAEFTCMTEFPRAVRVIVRKWLLAMAAELAIGLAVVKRMQLPDWLAESLVTTTRDGWLATEEGTMTLLTLRRDDVLGAVDDGLARLAFFESIVDRAAE